MPARTTRAATAALVGKFTRTAGQASCPPALARLPIFGSRYRDAIDILLRKYPPKWGLDQGPGGPATHVMPARPPAAGILDRYLSDACASTSPIPAPALPRGVAKWEAFIDHAAIP